MGQQQILLLVVAAIVVVLAISIGIEMFAANATESNRESIYAELNNLGSMALQFYKKPIMNGGGGNSFSSWEVPTSLQATSNGTYSADAKNDVAIIKAMGSEIGNDGSNPIEMIATISPTEINFSVIN